jgi:hypothetical protein
MSDVVAEARERLRMAEEHRSGEPYVDDADLLRGLLELIDQYCTLMEAAGLKCPRPGCAVPYALPDRDTGEHRCIHCRG